MQAGVRGSTLSPSLQMAEELPPGLTKGRVLVWDAATGDIIVEPLKGHTAAIYSVGFSPEGQKIMSGGPRS